MAARKKEQGPKTIGRIISDPGRFDGRPFIHNTNVEVKTVLKLFRQGVRDSDIRVQLDLSGADLNACRAWQARFLPGTLTRKFNHAANVNFFMLDENISYLLLHDVVRLFGRSSHVYADGLAGKDDEKDIWEHMIANKYKAVLTADRDFIDISTRRRRKLIEQYGSLKNAPDPVPAVIYVGKKHEPREILRLIEKYQDEIKAFVRENDATYAHLTDDKFLRQSAEDRPRTPRRARKENRPEP